MIVSPADFQHRSAAARAARRAPRADIILVAGVVFWPDWWSAASGAPSRPGGCTRADPGLH